MRVYGPKHGELQPTGWQPDNTYLPNPYFMEMAVRYAGECVERGQHPVGAVVTRTQEFRIIDAKGSPVSLYECVAGVGVNEVNNSSTQHAEIVSLGKAEMYHGRRRLADLKSVLYTTHEPCPMCAGAITNSKVAGVVCGTSAADATRLANEEGIKWRSNGVSGLDVIRGRQEMGAPGQFIIEGFMRSECMELLRTAGRLTFENSSTGRFGDTLTERVKRSQVVYDELIATGVDKKTADEKSMDIIFGDTHQ